LKKPPGCCAGVAGPVTALPGWPGCVIERSIGAAVVGAVRVEGGAENVREPRLPKLEPPPARASASFAINASAATTDRQAKTLRKWKRRMETSQQPGKSRNLSSLNIGRFEVF
jgi:hypothetical protein